MADQFVLQMKNITKYFGPNAVLENVDFTLKKGEIHALLGANGAGKSTLMKILNGIFISYEGEIILNGNKVKPRNPSEASSLGISMIHQELELVDNLSICRNMWLGKELLKKKTVLDYERMRRETQKLLDELEFDLQADMLVSDLSIAQRQLVLIACAIGINPQLIIMDEPTSSLSISDVDNLFRVIKSLKKRDISIIYISHYLEEIFRIADRITVLRNGKLVTAKNIEDCTQEKIVEWMIGSKDIGGGKLLHKAPEPKVILDVQGLSQVNGIVKDVSFQIRKGEILGLAGVVGSGRTETAQIIFGADNHAKGTISVSGKTFSASKNTTENAVRMKIGYIPEDRKKDALLTTRSVMENMGVVAIDSMRKNGVIQYGRLKKVVNELITKLAIMCTSPTQNITSLSGGNQQKVVLGKWLCVHPEVLIMDQPTRGIDIGAKNEIYTLVNELANRGMSILFISDELEEIMNLADRVLVMKHGSIVAEFDNFERCVKKSTLLGTMIGESC